MGQVLQHSLWWGVYSEMTNGEGAGTPCCGSPYLILLDMEDTPAECPGCGLHFGFHDWVDIFALPAEERPFGFMVPDSWLEGVSWLDVATNVLQRHLKQRDN